MKGACSRPHIAPAACLALVLASCAAPLRYATPVDPMAVLPRNATVYLKLGHAPLGDFAQPLLDILGPSASSSKSMRSMLAKTESAAVALFPGRKGEDRAQPGSSPRFEAVLLGDYPYRSATFALRQDRQWRKDGRGRALIAPTLGLGLSFPGPGIALATSDGGQVASSAGKAAGTGGAGGINGEANGAPNEAPGSETAGNDRGAAIEVSIEALVDRLLVPGASAIPPGLSALCDSDIVAWVPDPFGRLAGEFFGSEAAVDIDIPAVGVLLAARRVAGPEAEGGEAVYELTVVFLMRNEEDARTFRPAIRLAWYGLSRSLLTGEAGFASLRFELAGDAVTATGLRVKASSIASALSMVARNAR